MSDATEIVVTGDCDCPVCGAPEVANRSDPILQWRVNVRAYKVSDDRGLWWSECLPCKETDGNGWFAMEDGNIVIEPSRIAVLEARGNQITKIESEG